LALQIWGGLDGISRTKRKYGKGTITWGLPLNQVLAEAGVREDAAFDCSNDKIAWIHRRYGSNEIYFVANRTAAPLDVNGRFRVRGKAVELWHADKGEIEPASYAFDSSATTVSLSLTAHESVFVVFGNTTLQASRQLPKMQYTPVGELTGSWKLSFPKGYGAPESINIPRLRSWTDNAEAGVKYFSGTGAYTQSFEVKKEWLKPGQRLLLDLGLVKDMAELFLNGTKIDFLWKAPFQADITHAVKGGMNELEIRVTNEWTNRWRGDQEDTAHKVLASYPIPFGRRQYELAESGLLGPVKLLIEQTQSPPPTLVAGIPVNYDEDKVGAYTLPDPLKLNNGRKVTDAKTWTNKRRLEIVKLFEQYQFGKAPGKPAGLAFNVFDPGTPVLNGAAIRKQLTVYFTKDSSKSMDVLIYLPANTSKPAPLLLNISFVPNSLSVEDDGVKAGYMWTRDGKKVPATRSPFRKFDVEKFISNGIGVAFVYYGDIEPDFNGGLQYGIRAEYLSKGEQPGSDEWGAIAAWAWGLSRAMDYFETDKDIDARKVIVTGASRLGKTVLWAGARDERFAMIIASVSGEGGAALSRRNYGETVAHITDTSRYFYQFAPNYHSFSNRVDQLPMDAHMLIALIAPRPLLLQTGNTDYWSDPKGEFLAAVAAEPVYKLFGKQGPGTDTFPQAGDTSLLHTLGYYMHDGGHGVLPQDYDVFIQFIRENL
jgi:hypothetical protein